jgi:hypothetical protein
LLSGLSNRAWYLFHEVGHSVEIPTEARVCMTLTMKLPAAYAAGKGGKARVRGFPRPVVTDEKLNLHLKRVLVRLKVK